MESSKMRKQAEILRHIVFPLMSSGPDIRPGIYKYKVIYAIFHKFTTVPIFQRSGFSRMQNSCQINFNISDRTSTRFYKFVSIRSLLDRIILSKID